MKCNWKRQHDFQWDAVSMSLKRTHTVEGSITALHCWSPIIASKFLIKSEIGRSQLRDFVLHKLIFIFENSFESNSFQVLKSKQVKRHNTTKHLLPPLMALCGHGTSVTILGYF